MKLETRRYTPKTEVLKPLIKYFWVFETSQAICLNHKILPMGNIDLIFNLKAHIQYEKRGTLHKTPGNIYFSGLRSEHIVLKQKGEVLDIGVSFFPAGLYPFFHIPISEFKNQTIGLSQVLGQKANHLEQELLQAKTIEQRLSTLEIFFMSLLKKNPVSEKIRELIQFYVAQKQGISAFCSHHGVSQRTLERMFNRHVGVSPKHYLRLNRFGSVLSYLIWQSPEQLTPVAHAFDFHDQSHFINDFKAFSGAAPSQFLKEKQSILQISTMV